MAANTTVQIRTVVFHSSRMRAACGPAVRVMSCEFWPSDGSANASAPSRPRADAMKVWTNAWRRMSASLRLAHRLGLLLVAPRLGGAGTERVTAVGGDVRSQLAAHRPDECRDLPGLVFRNPAGK